MTQITITQEEYDMLNQKAAELHSLKMSLLESKLVKYFPKREMSFHDKIVLAIDKAIK
jgi:hypothetical protein